MKGIDQLKQSFIRKLVKQGFDKERAKELIDEREQLQKELYESGRLDQEAADEKSVRLDDINRVLFDARYEVYYLHPDAIVDFTFANPTTPKHRAEVMKHNEVINYTLKEFQEAFNRQKISGGMICIQKVRI